MADDKKAEQAEPAKKRTVLTDEQRIAQAEARLAELRTKAQEKAQSKIKVLKDKVAKATEAHRKTETKLVAARRELEQAEKAAAPQPATPQPTGKS